MKILITGGFGFLGGRLAQYLAEHTPYDIVLGTRHHADPPAWLPQARVVQTAWHDPVQLARCCENVDAILHLAGMSAQDCAANPIAALECNAIATAQLLQTAVQKNVRRFIYLSTAHVYGSPLTGVISETTCPSSLHPYATSKRAGEDVVRTAHQRGEIEGVVIRLSNAYGAPAHRAANCWMLLINDLCRQAATTRRMVLKTSGLQRRNFLPMSDACRAIAHLLQIPMPTGVKNVVNVGGAWSPTVWEAACLVQERCTTVLGFTSELTRITPQPHEVVADLDYRCDVLRASGVEPASDTTTEIDRLLDFCKVFQ